MKRLILSLLLTSYAFNSFCVGNFNIIVAGHKEKGKAISVKDQYVAKGFVNSHVLASPDGRVFRVSIDSYKTREEAQMFLTKYQRENKIPLDAWSTDNTNITGTALNEAPTSNTVLLRRIEQIERYIKSNHANNVFDNKDVADLVDRIYTLEKDYEALLEKIKKIEERVEASIKESNNKVIYGDDNNYQYNDIVNELEAINEKIDNIQKNGMVKKPNQMTNEQAASQSEFLVNEETVKDADKKDLLVLTEEDTKSVEIPKDEKTKTKDAKKEEDGFNLNNNETKKEKSSKKGKIIETPKPDNIPVKTKPKKVVEKTEDAELSKEELSTKKDKKNKSTKKEDAKTETSEETIDTEVKSVSLDEISEAVSTPVKTEKKTTQTKKKDKVNKEETSSDEAVKETTNDDKSKVEKKKTDKKSKKEKKKEVAPIELF